MAERFNRRMEQFLSKVVKWRKRDLVKHMPLFLMAYRAAVHETFGQTPAKVILEKALRLSCHLVFGSATTSKEVEATSYVETLH